MKNEDIDKEIIEAEANLAALKTKKANREKLTPEQNVAILLHDLLCRSEHAQDCGWFYEIDSKHEVHDWSRYAHKWALDRAVAVVSAVGVEAATKFILAIKGVK